MSADLYRMLGRSPDVDAIMLRHTYEQHMADAVRSHDHRRALALSAAFDALPDARRRAVYFCWSEAAPAPAPARTAKAARSRLGMTPPPRRRRRRGKYVIALVVVAIVALAAWRVHESSRQRTYWQVPTQQR